MEQRLELARVLVIDNDPQVGIDLCEMLEPLGYTVKFICTDGLDVPGAIIANAQIFRPHVAIVDVRLVDDYTPDSHTVFDLLGYLKSARCVLYSAYLDANVTRKANREQVFDWLSKAGEPADLIETVKNGANKTSARAVNASIPWPENWNRQATVANIIETDSNIPLESLIDDVVIQLLQDHPLTEMNEMRRNNQESLAASRGRSAVFEVKSHGFAPNVLKLAKATRIRDERENYAKHVDNRLPGGFHTQLRQSVDFWDIGGALYSFVGTEENALPSLSERYRTETDPQKIVAPIDFFVRHVWRPHYNARKISSHQSLFALYDQVFKISTRLQRVNDSGVTDNAGYTREDIADMIAWAPYFEHASRYANIYEAVTHGDFHGDNIFVDASHAWVIDFERTGEHHVLLDIVELQVDVLTRLVPFEEVDGALYTRLVEACITRSAEQARQDVRRNPHCNKARKVVSALQELAEDECGPYHPEEMLWGMLFDALYVATIEQSSLPQRQRALLLSTVLMRQLKPPA